MPLLCVCAEVSGCLFPVEKRRTSVPGLCCASDQNFMSCSSVTSPLPFSICTHISRILLLLHSFTLLLVLLAPLPPSVPLTFKQKTKTVPAAPQLLFKRAERGSIQCCAVCGLNGPMAKKWLEWLFINSLIMWSSSQQNNEIKPHCS